MMTKSYLLLAGLFIGATAFSQPTLTQANTAPQVGENFTFTRADWDGVAGSAGANQTWDFSDLNNLTTTTCNFVTPGSCPSASSFPAATVASNLASGQVYEFSRVSTTSFERVGLYASSTAIPYSDNEKLLSFPFTYNNTYVDAFAASFTSNNVTLARSGNVTVTADGYGTLILPNSTNTNVLRVKLVEDYGDSFMNMELYHYTNTIYMFYKVGTHQPILGLTHADIDGNVTNYANYIDSEPLGMNELSANAFSVYPNPASTILHIDLKATAAVKYIEIFNIGGTRVFETSEAVSTIDVSGLEAGVYFLNINGQVQKFVKN
jgi:hypothetical protein